MKPVGWRIPMLVEERHVEMVRLHKSGLLLKQIGLELRLDHSTIHHHLKGNCRCQINGYELHPRISSARVRVLRTLRHYGPLRCVALAAILSEERETVRSQLRALRGLGLATQCEGVWRALEGANG